jgi:guanine deaminase
MLVAGHLLLDPAGPALPGWLEIVPPHIAAIGEGEPPGPASLGGRDCLICPGFIDAHLHLPQMDVVGCDGMDLLTWLERVVYPAEARWSDQETADGAAAHAYRRLLAQGTLGFAGYLSSHLAGVVAALRAAQRLPLRALAGQVLMDREAPPELLSQPAARIANSRRGRYSASLNPRFAIACSDGLLGRAGALARRRDLWVQTHLAETIEERRRVAELFPHDPHYTGVYDRCGLLGRRTLLAHALHLGPDEWRLIAERGAVVVHCPTANLFLRAGLFDLGAARRFGVRLALGSDVAAGPDLAMPRVARAMIETAKARALTVDGAAPVPTPAEAWDLITRGNADALGWGDAGRLEVGAAADVLVLRPPFAPQDPNVVARLLYTWSSAYIAARIVAGIAVGQERPRG